MPDRTTGPSPDGREEPQRNRELHARDSSLVFQAAGDQYVVRPGASAPTTPTTPIVTNTLPRDIPAFIGRDSELTGLAEAVKTASSAGTVIALQSIDGMPGVGKTAFAVHVGHRLKRNFPDGQLFVDLHAHTAGRAPVEPTEALFALLSAVGVRPTRIPPGTDQRVALWRARMADKRMILVLDNAAHRQQVELLLPGAPGCLVLITSRHRLTGLGAQHAASNLPLETLSPPDAAVLFVKLTGRRDLAESEIRAVHTLVQLCGHLPLAIALLAARLQPEPQWRIADLVAELSTAQNRLGHLRAEDIAVASAFDLSLRTLTSARRRFFRHLSLHPGTDIDAYAAAALDGIDDVPARGHLDALYNDHLLDQPVHGRYRMHDLVREHSRNQVGREPATERGAAIERLLDYYVYTATMADRYIAPRLRPAPVPASAPAPLIPNLDAAMRWMRAEVANLFACVTYLTETRDDVRLIDLAAAMAEFVRRTGPWNQAIAMHRAAIAATHRIGDRLREADARQSLGALQRQTGNYPGAVESLNAALRAYQSLGNKLSEADALHELGRTYQLTYDYRSATETLEHALDLYESAADRRSQARVLVSLSGVPLLTDDHLAAIQTCQRALEIYRELDDEPGQADVLFQLGFVWRLDNNHLRAERVTLEALALYERLGDLRGQANSYHNLGAIRRMRDDFAGATAVLKKALALYLELGDRMGQANALRYLGLVDGLTDKRAKGIAVLQQALDIYVDIGERVGRAGALYNFGLVRRLSGEFDSAAECLREALDLYQQIGNRRGQAETLNELGILERERDDVATAVAQHGRALGLARQVGSALEQARALEGMAWCKLRIGDVRQGRRTLLDALEIFQTIDTADGVRIQELLSDLD